MSSDRRLSDSDLAEFRERGYVRVRGAFDRDAANEMAEFIWARLEALHGVRRDDRATWSKEGAWVGLNKFKNDAAFAPIGGPRLSRAIDDLLGAGAWERPKNWGGFLLSFPNCRPADWTIPPKAWHVDFHFTYDPDTLFGLRVFAFMSDLAPKGGCTLVVSGSHRLVAEYVRKLTPWERQGKFAELRDRFNALEPWLAELTRGSGGEVDRIREFLERPHETAGVRLEVEEICAEPGDAVLAHPWLLHAPSPNSGDRPRFMCAKDIFRKV